MEAGGGWVVVLVPTSRVVVAGGCVAMFSRLGGLLWSVLPILKVGGGTLLTAGGGI